MAPPKKNQKKQDISVVARLEVFSAEGTVEVRSFEKGWTTMREVAQRTTPVTCTLIDFVRKTDDEQAKELY